MKRVKIAPSILSADFAKLGQEISDVEKAGADWIHVDVMDGHFVPNITIGPVVVRSVRPVTKLPLDVHLMIRNPARYVESFAKAGADIITFHAEAEDDPKEVVRLIRYFKKKVGVSVKPRTDLARIAPVLSMVDMVLVMTVEPGFGGQEFILECLPKIDEVRKVFKKDVEVDGGVNAATAPEVIRRGANILVAGSAVFGSQDYATAIANIRGGE